LRDDKAHYNQSVWSLLKCPFLNLTDETAATEVGVSYSFSCSHDLVDFISNTLDLCTTVAIDFNKAYLCIVYISIRILMFAHCKGEVNCSQHHLTAHAVDVA